MSTGGCKDSTVDTDTVANEHLVLILIFRID